MTSASDAPRYEEDFAARLEDQSRRLRRGKTAALDLDNLAEELDTMGRGERREIRHRQTVLLTHLLKLSIQPKRRSHSSLATVSEQRDAIAEILADSPSLRAYPAETLDPCYRAARAAAARETGLPLARFPEDCPFEPSRILDPEWLP